MNENIKISGKFKPQFVGFMYFFSQKNSQFQT